MLLSLKKLRGYRLLAQDGEIGRVRDFYFDDAVWVVRYLVADTGNWLPDREVLIARDSLVKPDWQSRVFTVTLTRGEIEDSPSIVTDKPVSRQMEQRLRDYYKLPYYWGAREAGAGAAAATASLMQRRGKQRTEPQGDPNLRSLKEVTQYKIKALDGEIGHVEDFIANDVDWLIVYLVIDTRNWLPGRKVLIALDWIHDFDWTEGDVSIDLSCEQIANSPEFDPAAPVNREYEARLYDYYGRPKYWH